MPDGAGCQAHPCGKTEAKGSGQSRTLSGDELKVDLEGPNVPERGGARHREGVVAAVFVEMKVSNVSIKWY